MFIEIGDLDFEEDVLNMYNNYCKIYGVLDMFLS